MRSKAIQIFLIDSDPNSVKIADLSNSTARVYVIPRQMMDYAQTRPDLKSPALYMLFDDERTSVYIGECENFMHRVKDHEAKKDFWQWAVVCIATGNGLNKAEVKFLESHAVQKAIEIGRFEVQNRTNPAKNNLHEFTQETILDFFEDAELLFTTLGFNVFEPLKDSMAKDLKLAKKAQKEPVRLFDTIVCPATGDGLQEAFIDSNAWWAVRIGSSNISKLKFISIYESAPISAIRYYAKIKSIEPFEDKPGKYKINHDGKILKFEPVITLGSNPTLSLYGPRYYLLEDMLRSGTLGELTNKAYGTAYIN